MLAGTISQPEPGLHASDAETRQKGVALVL